MAAVPQTSEVVPYGSGGGSGGRKRRLRVWASAETLVAGAFGFGGSGLVLWQHVMCTCICRHAVIKGFMAVNFL